MFAIVIAGALTARLSNDTRLIEAAFSTAVAKQMQALFCLAVGLAIGLTASWRISLVVLASFPVNIAASAIQMQVIAGETSVGKDDEGQAKQSSSGAGAGAGAGAGGGLSSKKSSSSAVAQQDIAETPAEDGAVSGAAAESDGDAVRKVTGGSPTSMLATAFTHMRTVCAFSMQNHLAAEYAELTRAISQRRQDRSLLAGLGFGGSNFVLYCTYALLFWYGSTLLEDDVVSFIYTLSSLP